VTQAEWLASEDPLAMLGALRDGWRGEEADLVRLTHRYLLACCRAIWVLLPLEESRRGVEVAERYIDGQATREEFGTAEWDAEGAAFFLELFEWEPTGEEDPEARQARIRHEEDRRARSELLARQVQAIPPLELRRLVRPTANDLEISPRQLLSDAAYFADTAMCYPGIRPREGILEKHAKFLSTPVLREFVGNPFRPGVRDPAWLSRDVLMLLKMIDEERAFDRMPILGDALEDVGCPDVEMLSHCRERVEHVRGCWVVDTLLGRRCFRALREV
jgi:hypothetical protein